MTNIKDQEITVVANPQASSDPGDQQTLVNDKLDTDKGSSEEIKSSAGSFKDESITRDYSAHPSSDDKRSDGSAVSHPSIKNRRVRSGGTTFKR